VLQRRALIAALVPVALGAAGCSDGQVKLDDSKFDEDFGSVKSAVLVHDPKMDGDEYYVVLANKSGVCKDLQEILPQQYVLEDDYQTAWEDFNDVLFDWANPNYMDAVTQAFYDLCEAQTAYLNGMVDLYDQFVAEGDHFVTVSFWNEDDYNIFPEDGVTYDIDADWDEDGFSFGLVYYFGNPYAPVLDAWDEDACKSLDVDQMSSAFDDVWDAMDEAQDFWNADGGTATVKVKSDTKILVEYSGDLQDMEGNDAGPVEGDFKAKVCEIEYD